MTTDDWRQRRDLVADWTRRFNDCKARAKRLTRRDPPEKHAAMRAEIDALIAEKQRLGKDDA